MRSGNQGESAREKREADDLENLFKK